MKKSHKLLACLVTTVVIAVSAIDGFAQAELEPGVINLADVQWSAPGERPCYPLVIQVRRAGPADFHFVDCQTG